MDSNWEDLLCRTRPLWKLSHNYFLYFRYYIGQTEFFYSCNGQSEPAVKKEKKILKFLGSYYKICLPICLLCAAGFQYDQFIFWPN